MCLTVQIKEGKGLKNVKAFQRIKERSESRKWGKRKDIQENLLQNIRPVEQVLKKTASAEINKTSEVKLQLKAKQQKENAGVQSANLCRLDAPLMALTGCSWIRVAEVSHYGNVSAISAPHYNKLRQQSAAIGSLIFSYLGRRSRSSSVSPLSGEVWEENTDESADSAKSIPFHHGLMNHSQ